MKSPQILVFADTPFKLIVTPPLQNPNNSSFNKNMIPSQRKSHFQQHSKIRKRGISLTTNSINQMNMQNFNLRNIIQTACEKSYQQNKLIKEMQYQHKKSSHSFLTKNKNHTNPTSTLKTQDQKQFILHNNQRKLLSQKYNCQQNQQVSPKRNIIQRSKSTTKKQLFYSYQTPKKNIEIKDSLSPEYKVKLIDSCPSYRWLSQPKKKSQAHTQYSYGIIKSLRKMQDSSFISYLKQVQNMKQLNTKINDKLII